MLCTEHSRGAFTAAGGPCKECGEDTNSCFELCDTCSERFDECAYCRTPLKSGGNPSLIAAFKCDAAVAARKARREALDNCWQRFQAAADIFQEAQKPAEAELKEGIKPFQEKLQAATREFNDAYALVCSETDAVRDNPNATAGEKLDARNRWVEAMNNCSKQCRPHREQFDRDLVPLRALYDQQVAPFKKVQEAAIKQAQDECDAALKKADAQIESILDAALPLGERIRKFLFRMCEVRAGRLGYKPRR